MLPFSPRRFGLLPVLAALSLAACGNDGSTATSASTGSGSGGTSSTGSANGGASSGTGDAGMIDRGPTSIALEADPNGLWWDDATGTLYIADDGNNRVLEWTEATGVKLVANLPAAPQDGPGLGQIVKTADGKLVVTRFGFGTAGDVVYVDADGTTTGTVPGLDVTKRRIGLTVASDGTLYDGYFVKTATSQIGAVAKLDLAGAETDVITSLSKPVGVFADGANLIMSDQAKNSVLEAPIATPANLEALVAAIDGPDLLCAGPGGTYFTGGTTGEVRQITAAGAYSTFAGGFLQIRGVAYDAKNKRLFAAEHDPDGTMNALRILPVN